MFEALAFCALGKSSKATPLSVSVTFPVGHTNVVVGKKVVDDRFSQVCPPAFFTSTRRIYAEPYGRFCAAALSTALFPLKVPKFTTISLVLGATLTAMRAQ